MRDCGDPKCQDCYPSPTKNGDGPLTDGGKLRTVLKDPDGNVIGYAEAQYNPATGELIREMQLAVDPAEVGRSLRGIEGMSLAEVLADADKPLRRVVVGPRGFLRPVAGKLRITKPVVVPLGRTGGRYQPCVICKKPTKTRDANRQPLCGKCCLK